jgi:hypothetical protein
MKYKVGDLLITKQYVSIMTKDDRYEHSNSNKIFLIINFYKNGYCQDQYDLISQETGSISDWNASAIDHCFNKV